MASSSATDDSKIKSSLPLSPPAVLVETKAAAAGSSVVECDGVEFTVTERNELALVVWSDTHGVVRVVECSDSYLASDKITRHHFVYVQGEAEPDVMLFYVIVCEHEGRILEAMRSY